MNQGKIKLNAKLIYPSSFGHSLSAETLSPALAARQDEPGPDIVMGESSLQLGDVARRWRVTLITKIHSLMCEKGAGPRQIKHIPHLLKLP